VIVAAGAVFLTVLGGVVAFFIIASRNDRPREDPRLANRDTSPHKDQSKDGNKDSPQKDNPLRDTSGRVTNKDASGKDDRDKATMKDSDPNKKTIQTAKLVLDTFGNPKGKKLGLASDVKFDNARLLLWSGDPEVKQYIFTADNPLWKALKARGFVLQIESGAFQPKWLQEADQMWLFAGRAAAMNEEGYKGVMDFVQAGKGLYLMADNEPYLQEAEVLAQRLFGTHVKGDYIGQKIAYVKGRGLTPEQIAKYGGQYEVVDHPLLTGLNFLYEGITISHVEPCDKLDKAILASDGQILAAVSRDPKQRVVIDCGWTRYYYGATDANRFITRTAGTIRFGENVAVYLMGKGRS
jgi:hypothetical protein